MKDAVFGLLMVWGGVSSIWILIYYFALRNYKQDFFFYKLHHQKFIALFIETARHNRELIVQNQRYKHAVADAIFHKNGFRMEEIVQWYKKYEIKSGLSDEKESSKEEVEHFIRIDKDGTKYSNSVLR